MSKTSDTSTPPASLEFTKLTFSAALAAGLTHSDWLAGQRTSPSGRRVALVSHSVQPDAAAALTTPATFGPLFAGSSPSAALQSSLANRLRAAQDLNGSPEFAMTWREWDMPSGPPICRLRALARRTSDSGCSGWPTPDAQAMNDGADPVKHAARMKRLKAKHNNGNGAGATLAIAAATVPWPTPNARDGDKGQAKMRTDGGQINLSGIAAATVPWATPTAKNAPYTYGRGKKENRYEQLEGQARGVTPESSPAETAKPAGYRLNPSFSRWLMGYGVEWLWCVPHSNPAPRSKKRTGTTGSEPSKDSATPSSRKSRRRS